MWWVIQDRTTSASTWLCQSIFSHSESSPVCCKAWTNRWNLIPTYCKVVDSVHAWIMEGSMGVGWGIKADIIKVYIYNFSNNIPTYGLPLFMKQWPPTQVALLNITRCSRGYIIATSLLFCVYLISISMDDWISIRCLFSPWSNTTAVAIYVVCYDSQI